MTNAIKGLVTDAAAASPVPSGPKVITPAENTPPANPVPETETSQQPNTDSGDGVVVAHKKVIKPLSNPNERTPNLDELLAKEGFANFNDDSSHAQQTATVSDVAPGGAPAPVQQQPAATPSLPTTPHPPGHVISPTGSGVDPNSIAL